MLLRVFRVCLREPQSVLIKYNTTETPKIDNMINFILRFNYSLVIIRNEMMILLHTTDYIHSVKKHDIPVKY